MRLGVFFLILIGVPMTSPCELHAVDKPAEVPGVLRAGAAVTDMTPELGVSLSGLLLTAGPVQKIIDPLRVRCLVLDNGQKRLAIVLCDVCVMTGEVIEKAKVLAQQKTGLSKDHILVAATHTHMAPRMAGWSAVDKNEINSRYYDLVAHRIADAIQQAIKNLAPARIGWGAGQKPEFLVNRRWIMKPGTAPRDPFGGKNNRIVMGRSPGKNRIGPAGPVDPELTVLSVQHADGKPLALLGNYGMHYGTLRSGVASADYFGRFAGQVEEFLGGDKTKPPVVGIMSNGASADVSSAGGDFKRMEKVADAIAADAILVSKGIKYQDRVVLAMQEVEVELGVRKPDAKRLTWAEKLLAEAGGKPNKSGIYADEALHLSKFPEKILVKLQALRIGDLGIVAIPAEVFAETGLAIKEDSPFTQTITISHANGWHGYLPPPRHHKLGGMEVWPRRASYLEVDASTKIRDALQGLLQKMLSMSSPQTQ